MHVSATQAVMQVNLLTFSQSELCVELMPRPPSSLSSSELEPLRLSVTWSHDDRFRLQVSTGVSDVIDCRLSQLTEELIRVLNLLQVSEETAGLVEDSRTGRWAELSAALLEVMQCYVGQAELLSEIGSLRSR